MKKISPKKTFSFSPKSKLNRQNYMNNLKSNIIKKENKKILDSSPEKECSSINEIVKQSVEKINNLFQQTKLSGIDGNISFNSNNKIKFKDNFNFNSINTIEDANKYQAINEENKFNNILTFDDGLHENTENNIDSGLIVDVSAIKRNIKQHSFNVKYLFKSNKNFMNEIVDIHNNNKYAKNYVIQNNKSYETLFNPKSPSINLQNSLNNLTPLKNKNNYLLKTEDIKDSPDTKISTLNDFNKKPNRRSKYYSIYKNNFTHKINAKNNNKSKSNFDINNSIQKNNSTKTFDINYRRGLSSRSKEKKNEKYNILRYMNDANNTIKNSFGFNYLNTRIQKVNEIRIYPSIDNRKDIYKTRTENHHNRIINSEKINQLYSKEFPLHIKTNDILKLMLFLNEYIINNNLLDDYYVKKNQNILEEYSKFLALKIQLNYPQETDISCDNFVSKTKIIQRNWRKLKVMKYLEKNKLDEGKEMKKMIINNYIEKAGYKIKKFFGLFHNLIEQFNLLDSKDIFSVMENNINKCFYLTKKIITKKLTYFEKSELYKDYINKVIYNK